MDNQAVQSSIGRLKLQHRQLGMMIGDLEVAVQTLNGDTLLYAIDEIALKYSVPAF
jgi:hypothetical protein